VQSRIASGGGGLSAVGPILEMERYKESGEEVKFRCRKKKWKAIGREMIVRYFLSGTNVHFDKNTLRSYIRKKGGT